MCLLERGHPSSARAWETGRLRPSSGLARNKSDRPISHAEPANWRQDDQRQAGKHDSDSLGGGSRARYRGTGEAGRLVDDATLELTTLSRDRTRSPTIPRSASGKEEEEKPPARAAGGDGPLAPAAAAAPVVVEPGRASFSAVIVVAPETDPEVVTRKREPEAMDEDDGS